MSIGEILAEARSQAGLTVDEVSDRTGIRETVISAIERDDYDACGGDIYVNGYIRVIAAAVGTDPQPLIDEYNATERPAPEPSTGPAPVLPRQAAEELQRATEQSSVVGTAMPARASRVRPRLPLAQVPERMRVDRARGWRRVSVISGLALAVLALLGAGGYAIASSLGGAKAAPEAKGDSAVVRHGGKPSTTPSRVGTASTAIPAHASHRVAPRRSAHAVRAKSAAHAASRARLLAPLSAIAFGPDGVADGDNPQGAAFPLDGDQGLPWETDWYTTPVFGDLKEGTGLLLDMGRRVTITGAELILGDIPGANLQLRAGDSPVLTDLRPAASASGAAGATWLRLRSEVRARYVLIWFTLLPPDAAGTYQARVYGIRLY